MERTNEPQVRTTTTLNARNRRYLLSKEQDQQSEVTLHETTTTDGVNRTTDPGRIPALKPLLLQYIPSRTRLAWATQTSNGFAAKTDDNYVKKRTQHKILRANRTPLGKRSNNRYNRRSHVADQTTRWRVNVSGLCQDTTRSILRLIVREQRNRSSSTCRRLQRQNDRQTDRRASWTRTACKQARYATDICHRL